MRSMEPNSEALAATRGSRGETSGPSVDPTVLALGVAMALVFGWLLDSSSQSKLTLVVCAIALALWPRRRISAALRNTSLFLLALVIGTLGVKDDVARLLDGEVRVWNVYHYYLGAKYFPELGYQDLYVATLAADREEHRVFEPHVQKIRSLRTYEVRRLNDEDRAYDPAAHFTPARWNEFKRDVHALSKHRSPRGWRNVFRDRGYNGTPTWTALGRLLTGWIPASSPGLLLLCSLDLVLLTLTAFFFERTFGYRLVTAALLLFVASPTNVARLVGGFLQTDWLCAVVLGACLLQRRRFGWAAVALAFAVTTRVFPAVLVATACMPLLFGLLRQRSWKVPPSWRRFLLAFTASCLLAVGLGSAGNGRGTAGWTEFVEAISVHRATHVIGDRRIGLEHAFTQPLGKLDGPTSDDHRVESLEDQRGVYLLTAVGLVVLCIPVLVRLRPSAALVFGMVPVFALTVLSRYYFGLLALFPLAAPSWRAHAAQLVPFALYYAMAQSSADDHTAYAWLNAFLALYFIGLAVTLAQRPSTSVLDASSDLAHRAEH